MTNPAIKPAIPTRLVLITSDGVAAYEGREMLAYLKTDYEFDAQDIEDIRTKRYQLEPVE